MALTQNSLSSKLQTEIKGLLGIPADNQRLVDVCDAIAKAVVDEIQANAVVNGTTSVSGGSSSGTWPTTGTVS
jgi:hypothetical protein